MSTRSWRGSVNNWKVELSVFAWSSDSSEAAGLWGNGLHAAFRKTDRQDKTPDGMSAGL